jgi:hypothetical protein
MSRIPRGNRCVTIESLRWTLGHERSYPASTLHSFAEKPTRKTTDREYASLQQLHKAVMPALE